MVTILAPHPDDELIGCHSLLAAQQVSRVIYFFDHEDAGRRVEANSCGAHFGFTTVFADINTWDPRNAGEGTICLPSRHDSHPHHKAVNQLRRHFEPERLCFYSVDLDRAPNKFRAADYKKQRLDELYPSQAALWEANASYYLFEAVVSSDVSSTTWRIIRFRGGWYRLGIPSHTTFDAAFTEHSSIDQFVNTLAARGEFELQELTAADGIITRTWK